MDKTIILLKIESLQRCTSRLISKRPSDPAALKNDWDLQDIIVLNLQRSVQICVDIAAHIISEQDQKTPLSMADSFIMLHEAGIIDAEVAERMIKSVSFRNVAVHRYQDIDWHIVFRIITDHLDDFRTFAKEVAHWLDRS
jgi:uncharacterized protein YutE (UPF0331/DUF86 family)